MSFSVFERSRNRGHPVNLFLFEYGSTPNARIGITNAEQPILHDGVQYIPHPMDRDTIKASGNLDKAALTVRTERDSPVAELFRVYPPSQPVRLTIFQGHLNDPDQQFLVAWTGRVLSVKWEKSEALLNCEPIATSLRRPGLRRRYGPVCPHVLYGPICRANKEAATISTTMRQAANGVRLVSIMYTPNEAMTNRLRNGTFEWTVAETGSLESRLILAIKVENNIATLTLSGIVRNLPQGHPVNLVLGCNHQLGDCENVHNNVPNFGGMPWIPTKNPYGKYSPYQ